VDLIVERRGALGVLGAEIIFFAFGTSVSSLLSSNLTEIFGFFSGDWVKKSSWPFALS